MKANFDITAMDMNELEGVKAKLKNRFSVLVNGYLEDAVKYLKGIEDGLENSDLNTVATNAHPLKSSSAALGLSGLSDIARAIEETAKEGGAIDTIRSLETPLKEALDYVTPKLRASLDDAE